MRIRSSLVVGLIEKDRIEAGVVERRSKRLGLLDRIVEDEHAVDAGVGRGPREHGRIHAHDRVGVGEENDRRVDLGADAANDLERAAKRHAAGERPLAGALNHRTIGQRIRKRHADFEHIRAGAGDGDEQRGRTIGVRIARSQVGDEAAAAVIGECARTSVRAATSARLGFLGAGAASSVSARSSRPCRRVLTD